MSMPTLEDAKRSVRKFIDHAEQRDDEIERSGERHAVQQRRTMFYAASRELVDSVESVDALLDFLTEAWLLDADQIAAMITLTDV